MPYKTKLFQPILYSNWGLAPIVSANLHATEAAVILSSTHKRLAVLVNCYTAIINSS